MMFFSSTTFEHEEQHFHPITLSLQQGRGVHVTGVSAAYTFKLNKNILSE
jgi:hypothetical protein